MSRNELSLMSWIQQLILNSSRFFPRLVVLLFVLFAFMESRSAFPSIAQVNGDQKGIYSNPVLYADYSDPDVIRVGKDFYMTASSFNCVPGLPLLHSKNLVNWEIIGHALAQQVPAERYDVPQHGNGVWAPSIRFHNGEYVIYYGDPDLGIYLVRSKTAAGPWEKPLLVKEAKGWIDPCPFWDDDGNAYLVHAWAKSRAGVNSMLTLCKMDSAGTKVIDDGRLIFDGHGRQPTIEGPKLYKRNGYYYIFAPAGGVTKGWQVVLRSKSIYGPYEDKIVMTQGKTFVNGPHQGAWVELQSGESWFIHFQDMAAYGRIVHLQPMVWKDDWPVIGSDDDGDAIGEPVPAHAMPDLEQASALVPLRGSDEFDGGAVGSQWQWEANPKPGWTAGFADRHGLRMLAIPPPARAKNLWDVPNLLLQKISGPAMTLTIKAVVDFRSDGEKAGLIVFGQDYSYLALERKKGRIYLTRKICLAADTGSKEVNTQILDYVGRVVYFRARIDSGAICNFMYSEDGDKFSTFGPPFAAKPAKWVGAKIGLFCLGSKEAKNMGSVDFDWVHVE